MPATATTASLADRAMWETRNALRVVSDGRPPVVAETADVPQGGRTMFKTVIWATDGL